MATQIVFLSMNFPPRFKLTDNLNYRNNVIAEYNTVGVSSFLKGQVLRQFFYMK